MNSLQFPYSIQITNSVPIDIYYGPYATVEDAIIAVPSGVRYSGLTVYITGISEYWWTSDLSDSGLLPKSLGITGITGISAGGDLTGFFPDPTLKEIGISGIWGSSTQVPEFTTDANGRVIGVTGVNIYYPVTSFENRTGPITLLSSDVDSAMGYTPYSSTNPSNYVSKYDTILSGDLTGIYQHPNVLWANSYSTLDTRYVLNTVQIVTNGGNSFGTTLIIGTTDNNAVRFILNGTGYLSLYGAGTFGAFNGKWSIAQDGSAIFSNNNFVLNAAGIITTGTWQGTAIADSYISSASIWNSKQAALSGSGIVKSASGTISYITGTSSQFVKGDGSLDSTTYVTTVFGRNSASISAQSGDYNTSQVTENTNLYFTNARAIASTLTGYVSGSGTISSTDTILSAIQKLNGNIALVTNAVVYQGTWNASTNTPTLTSSTGTKGYMYKVSVAGTTTLDGISQWNIGDELIFDGTVWDKIDGISSEVLSVNGLVGAVPLTGTSNQISISGSNVFSISATYAGQNSIITVGTITTGTWQGTAIADSYISSASIWNSKQAALSGSGIVKSSSGTISYITGTSSQFVKGDGTLDSNTYLTTNQSITLSGEASGSGNTAITVTLSNGAVIGKVLTGYSSTTGVITSSDTILSAIEKLNGNMSASIGGVSSVNGITGAVPLTGTSNQISISGSNVFSISSGYTGQTSISTLGTITMGTWQGSAIQNSYIASASIWNGKQNALSGSGIVTSASGIITYISGTSSQFVKGDGSLDSNTYLTTGSASSTYLPVSNPVFSGLLSGGNIALSPTQYMLFNGNSDTNWRIGYNMGAFTLTTVGTPLTIVTGTGTTDGFAIGGTGGQSYFEIKGSNNAVWFRGALTLNAYGTGILHSSSTGAITSSLITGPDITNGTIDLTSKVTGLLPDSNISSASNWNSKQAALSGTGIVESNNGSISYINGSSSQFVKGNGSLDSNTYITGLTGITAGGDLSGTYPNPTVAKLNGQLPSYYLSTTNHVEGTNLFFTNARTIASTLTGYVSGSGTISSADSILTAIEKLNGNISIIVSGVSSVNGITGAVPLTGTSNQITISGSNVFSISSGYSGQTSISTLGTVTTGTWQGSLIQDSYISSASNWNSKQAALSGSGIVKSASGTISYISGTSIQFVKGDGSLDSNTYITGISGITAGGDLSGTYPNPTVAKLNGQLPSYYLSTTNHVEGTNLFFTNARTIASTLTGYVSGSGTISSADSIISAIQKLNGNIALVTGAVVYQGTWNASTNSPTLTSSTGTKGYMYKVSVAGTTTLDGISQWNVGDQAIFDGTVWDKIDGIATEVLSVNGLVGAVPLSGTTGQITVSGSNQFGISSSYSGQTSISTLGTVSTGTWQGSLIQDSYISSASNWNSKQAALSGSGIVKSSSGTISYVSGTTGQFIKGDGSLDSNSYAISSTTNNYGYKSNSNRILYNKSFFTATTDFTASGFSPAPSIVNNFIRFTGGAGTFTQLFTLNQIFTDPNLYNEVVFRMSSTITSTSYGIGVGFYSINTWEVASFEVDINVYSNIIQFYQGSTSLSAANLPLGWVTSLNDIIRVQVLRLDNKFKCYVKNETQNVSIFYEIDANLLPTRNFTTVNTCSPCIWNHGGQVDILSVKVGSNAVVNPLIAIFGDSKSIGQGCGANSLRWGNLLGSLGNVAVFGGDGDRTVEMVQSISNSVKVGGSYAILNIGRNDLASGVATGTWQSNYASIVTTLTNAGYTVIHLIGINETTQSQTALYNYITTTYASGKIVDVSGSWSNSTMLASDNVHPNEFGQRYIASQIIASGFIPVSAILPWYQDLTEQVAVVPTSYGSAYQLYYNNNGINAAIPQVWYNNTYNYLNVGSTINTGGVLQSINAASLLVASGCYFNGTNYIATATSAVVQAAFNGTWQVQIASGLTAGANITASLIQALYVNAGGSVIIGPQSALSTTATDKFLYLPTSAGQPTGTPTNVTAKVAIEYDTTNNAMWVYNSSWYKFNPNSITGITGITAGGDLSGTYPNPTVAQLNGQLPSYYLSTTNMTEGTNKFYTNARSISSTLTGYVSSSGTITSSDTILSAIQKLNGNISASVGGVSSVNGITGAVTLTGTSNQITLSGSNVFSISTGYSGQTSISTLGTISTGTWQGSLIQDSYISSASTWNSKQAALSGSGIVKSASGTISYISGTNSQFVKGDGSLDSSTYITGLTGITAGGDLSGTYPNPTVAKLNGQLPSYYLSTSNMTEGTNLFFTNARSIASTLTGYVSGSGTISSSDSIISAIQKLNGNIALVTGAVVYQGTWNASTNTPSLTSSTGTKGYMYKVGVAGTTTLDGISQWNVGDQAIFDGSVWDKIDGIATEVLSVNGLVGAVPLSGTIGQITISGSNVFSISSGYSGQTSISTLGTVTTGTWQGSLIQDSYISSASTWNSKQAALSGSGIVFSTSGTITYINGISSQFVKGDGSLDSNAYLNTTNPSFFGTLSTGNLGYSDSGILESLQSSLNSYNQFIIQNTNTGITASTDIVVSNNLSTATTYYGNFGMNSSNFTGSGSMNLPNAVYLTSTNGDLVLGSTTSNAIHFIINSGVSEVLTIGVTGAITTGLWQGTPITDAFIASSSNWNSKQSYLGGTGIVKSTGGTISYISGTSSQFIKADGSLDSSIYLSSSGRNLQTGPTYSIQTSDFSYGNGIIGAAYTGPRTFSVPAAATIPSGKMVYISDEAGTSSTNYIYLVMNGTDTLNGSTGTIQFISENYSVIGIYSDGVANYHAI